MFESIFKEVLHEISATGPFASQLWTEINTQYSTKGRFYHNVSHLDQVIEQLLQVKHEITDWPIIVLSVAYHDIIYKPGRKDNEEKSAELARGRLAVLGLPEAALAKCKQQILFTKTHVRADDLDTNFFTDADLSILGSESDTYARYARLIRQEFRRYPDLLYTPGRRNVLRHFLGMHSIFKTTYFQNKYEKQARVNIANELNMLD